MERGAENDLVTKAFLAQALSDLERHMDQRFESYQANTNEAIAHAQARTLNWMVAIFLASTALVGAAVTTRVLFLTGRF